MTIIDNNVRETHRNIGPGTRYERVDYDLEARVIAAKRRMAREASRAQEGIRFSDREAA